MEKIIKYFENEGNMAYRLQTWSKLKKIQKLYFIYHIPIKIITGTY